MVISTQLKKLYLTIRSGDWQPKKQSLTCSLHRTLLSYVTFVVLKLTSLYTFICDKTNFECCLSFGICYAVISVTTYIAWYILDHYSKTPSMFTID